MNVPTWRADALPIIRTAGEFPHGDRDFAHRHGPAPHHALHLYDYAGVIRLGSRELRFQRGDLTITPARLASRYHLEHAGRHLCVHFTAPARTTRGGVRVALPVHLPMTGRVELARDKLRWIATLWGDAGRSSIARAGASAALLDLLLWLATCAQADQRVDAGPRTIAAVERAAHLITTGAHQPIDLAQLSREVDVSRNYLARAFRARFGVTMARFLLRRRMEIAAHLLETTDLSVSQVGDRVGVGDPHYFNKQFRRARGLSPSAFRRRAAPR
jgi:AraC-like DNA-binding protein